MVQNNNKVLTVSYGAFSCTLEGFDDSFETMKSIAEYFRDLASDDRFFGAEPPQPDAEMLANLAQRDVPRQVAVEPGHTGYHITAEPAPAADTRVVNQTQAHPSAPAQSSAPVPPAPVQDLPNEGIAAKLQRIRAVVNNEATPSESGAPDRYSEDEHAEDFLEAAPTSLAAALVTPQVKESVAAETDPAGSEHPFSDPDVSDPIAADASIAAKADAAATGLTEAAHDVEAVAEDTAQDVSMPLAAPELDAKGLETDAPETYGSAGDVGQSIPDSPETDVAGEGQTAGDEIRETWSTRVEDIIAADASAAVSRENMSPVEEEYEDDPDFVFNTPSQPRALDTGAAIEPETTPEVFAPDALDQDEDHDIDAVAQDNTETVPGSEVAEQQEAAPIDDAGAVETGDADPVARKTPRLLRVKKADLETAISSGLLEDVNGRLGAPSTLSAEDEADLMRQLAAVEADFSQDAQSEEATTTAEPTLVEASEPVELDRSASATFQSVDYGQDDLDRLMATAEAKLDDADNLANRQTYNQMRAAVVAAGADQSVGRAANGQEPADYRADLEGMDDVMRPHRIHPEVPANADQPQPVPQTEAAPLTLVAEQRIDTGATPNATDAPLNLSNPIHDGDADDGQPEEAFVAFVTDMGATSLAQLLEAAAAYLCFVEDRGEFSRPQLMNKVRQVETGNFSREDGLRAFGQLLREGKIEKTGGGRFTASGEIGYRPDDAREVG